MPTRPPVGLDKNKIELGTLKKTIVIRSCICDSLCEILSSYLPWNRQVWAQVNFGGPLENAYAL